MVTILASRAELSFGNLPAIWLSGLALDPALVDLSCERAIE
jgi:hypothetical protein